MPFVSDIKGPQQPVQTPATLATGALRRTSTIDTHPAQTGDSDVDLRARDVVAGQDGVEILGETRVRAHLSQRVIDDISSTPRDGRLARLLGSRVGPGFRSSVGKLLPGEAQRASQTEPSARRLGRRGPGVGLLGAARGDHPGYRGEVACRYRRQDGGYLRGVRPRGLAHRLRTAERHHPLGARSGGAAAGRPSPGGRAASARYATVPAARPRSRRGGVREFLCTLSGFTPRRRWRGDDRARIHRRGFGRLRRRAPSPRSPRTSGCCRGGSAPAPSAVQSGYAE